VSGAPGSGKTTLALALGAELDLPVLSKDTIKEALLATLGADDVAASKRLGAAAIAVLIALARTSRGAILESVWRPSLAVDDLTSLEGRVVEVFCACDAEVARARYADRAGARAAGHFDSARLDDDLWDGETAQPIDGGWPVVHVDTSTPVDAAVIADRVRALA
jgi:predicted kinase